MWKAGRNEGHLCLLSAKMCSSMVSFDGFVKAAVAVDVNAVRIMQSFRAIDADIQAKERSKLFHESLYLRFKVVLSVRTDADTRTTGKSTVLDSALLEEVVADVRNQWSFQQGFTANEVQDNRFCIFADERTRLVILPHLDKQVDNVLAGFQGHGLCAFVVFVAVVTAKIALVRYLKRDLANKRTVLDAGIQAMNIIVIVRQSR